MLMFSDIIDAVRFYSARELYGWVKMLLKSVIGMKREYELAFEQDPDGRWYVVFPGWPLNCGHLEMVAGADDMLNLLDRDAQHHRVTVSVCPSRKQRSREDRIELTCRKSSLGGGAFYTVQGLDGWGTPGAKREKQLWLCPVTLCVLGRYPKYIYVRQLPAAQSGFPSGFQRVAK